MTSPLRLTIPGSLTAAQNTWTQPPGRTAVLETRGDFMDGDIRMTAVTVYLQDVTLLRFTYVNPDELAAVEAQVAEFNADPDAVWRRMLTAVALRQLPSKATTLAETSRIASLASDHLPERSFHFLELGLDWAEEASRGLIPTGAAHMTQHPVSYGVSVHVSAQGFPFGSISLFNRPVDADQVGDIAREVERYNTDPTAAARAIAHDVLTADYQSRARDIAHLTARQRETAALMGALA